MVFAGAAAAFVPRVAYRLAVAFGEPPRASCAACGNRFPAGPSGWVRAGAACGHGGPVMGTVVASALAAGCLAVAPGPVSRLPFLLVAAVVGVLLAVIDMRCLRLPDPLVALFAVVAGAPLAVADPAGMPVALTAAALAGAGYLALALTGGLGLGDVKLGAVLAFVLGFGGWPAVAAGLGTAHLINGVAAAWLLLRHHRRDLPFGPALLVGALVATLLYGS